MKRTISIGGHTAEIKSENRSASIILQEGGVIPVDCPDLPEKISKSWLSAAIKQAEEVGSEEIIVYHGRYVLVPIKNSMHSRRGQYDTVKRYTKFNEWKAETKHIKEIR